MEAITKCGTVLTQALQDTSREWYGLAQKQLQRNLEGLSKLAHCRSVQDFAATQSGLVRESLEHMVEDSHVIVEISLKAVNDASKAVAGTAQERTAQGRSSPLDAGLCSAGGPLWMGTAEPACCPLAVAHHSYARLMRRLGPSRLKARPIRHAAPRNPTHFQ